MHFFFLLAIIILVKSLKSLNPENVSEWSNPFTRWVECGCSRVSLPCLLCSCSHSSFLRDRPVPRGRGMSVTSQPTLSHMLQLVRLGLCGGDQSECKLLTTIDYAYIRLCPTSLCVCVCLDLQRCLCIQSVSVEVTDEDMTKNLITRSSLWSRFISNTTLWVSLRDSSSRSPPEPLLNIYWLLLQWK